MSSRRLRWVGMWILASVMLIGGSARPAAAELNGDCQATGTFVTGTKADGSFTVDAATIGDTVVVVPRKDTVQWTGSVNVPATTRAYSGYIAVDLPPPFGGVTIDSWSGESDRVANNGVEEYSLPALVPAGVTFQVYGAHADQGVTCSGTVNVEIEGGAFGSPVTYVALGLTAATGAGLYVAIRPLLRDSFRRVA